MKGNIQNWILTIGVFGALYIAYQALVVVPQNQQASQMASQDLQRIEQQSQLQNCLSSTETTYSKNWASSCKSGYDACINNPYTTYMSCSSTWNPDANIPWNCLLSTTQSNRWDSIEQQQKQDCYKQYPQN